MNNYSYTTPYGTESLHEIILQAQIDDLGKKLSLIKSLCSNVPMMEKAVEKMVPYIQEYMKEELFREYGMELVILKSCLYGFGGVVTFKELYGVETIEDDLMPWAVGLALMERLQDRLPELENMTIQPQYVTNALNLALGRVEVSVCFQPTDH